MERVRDTKICYANTRGDKSKIPINSITGKGKKN